MLAFDLANDAADMGAKCSFIAANWVARRTFASSLALALALSLLSQPLPLPLPLLWLLLMILDEEVVLDEQPDDELQDFSDVADFRLLLLLK